MQKPQAAALHAAQQGCCWPSGGKPHGGAAAEGGGAVQGGGGAAAARCPKGRSRSRRSLPAIFGASGGPPDTKGQRFWLAASPPVAPSPRSQCSGLPMPCTCSLVPQLTAVGHAARRSLLRGAEAEGGQLQLAECCCQRRRPLLQSTAGDQRGRPARQREHSCCWAFALAVRALPCYASDRSSLPHLPHLRVRAPRLACCENNGDLSPLLHSPNSAA